MSVIQVLGILLSCFEVYLRVSERVDHGDSVSKAIRLSLKQSPYPVIIVGVIVFTSLFVIVLCTYHHKLAATGMSTYEELSFVPNHHQTSFKRYESGYFKRIWAILCTKTRDKMWQPTDHVNYDDSMLQIDYDGDDKVKADGEFDKISETIGMSVCLFSYLTMYITS